MAFGLKSGQFAAKVVKFTTKDLEERTMIAVDPDTLPADVAAAIGWKGPSKTLKAGYKTVWSAADAGWRNIGLANVIGEPVDTVATIHYYGD